MTVFFALISAGIDNGFLVYFISPQWHMVMGKNVYISQEQFEKGFRVLAKLGVTVSGMTIVKHVEGATPLGCISG